MKHQTASSHKSLSRKRAEAGKDARCPDLRNRSSLLPDSSSSAITVARCLSSCLPSSAITECNSVSLSSCLAACCSALCSARAACTSARTRAASVASLARVAANSLEFSSATSDRSDDSAAACSCNRIGDNSIYPFVFSIFCSKVCLRACLFEKRMGLQRV